MFNFGVLIFSECKSLEKVKTYIVIAPQHMNKKDCTFCEILQRQQYHYYSPLFLGKLENMHF